ncbi:hypothetical protein BFW01_g8945 [Lasiodiplodia theobromae]|nr:hypothetical protein BFW01_g8945 [Lasiodiplodia theobromae]
MVNLNISPRSTEDFISPELEAHAGFLAGARVLESEITKTINQAFHAGGIKEVLFTGHSAGAAVASILFMHYRVHGLNGLPIKFSSITFGGPPALRQTRLEKEWIPESGELWLNIVNEYDVIGRADKAYILSLVDLLRSVYGKLPLENTSGISLDSQNSGTLNYWTLRESDYRHYGDMIILQVSQEWPSLSGESVLTNDGLSVSTWKVSWADYSQLVFTRVRVHARTFYERNVGMIAEKFLLCEEDTDTEGRKYSFG